ncbi:hypothetical protein [Brevundimonas sp.]|uniref:hypothetical protein n=1 Tax=Brevundimonas sp. TaxID=1871086 RepID=UPI00286A1FF9|nr:hypothetical protein [Brevundimonas sp.]
MTLLFLSLCGVLAISIVSIVVLVALFDWASAPKGERLALSAIASGLLMAAHPRLSAGNVGMGDLIFLGGILALVVFTYGRRLAQRAQRHTPPFLAGDRGPEIVTTIARTRR